MQTIKLFSHITTQIWKHLTIKLHLYLVIVETMRRYYVWIIYLKSYELVNELNLCKTLFHITVSILVTRYLIITNILYNHKLTIQTVIILWGSDVIKKQTTYFPSNEKQTIVKEQFWTKRCSMEWLICNHKWNTHFDLEEFLDIRTIRQKNQKYCRK